MKRVLIFAALLAVTGCAHQDEWTRDDTAWQVIYTGVMAADVYAAAQIQHHPNIVETGLVAEAFMGANPSSSDALLYGVTLGFSNWLISRALPEGLRRYWQLGNIALHAVRVNEAAQLGLYGTPCEVHVCE